MIAGLQAAFILFHNRIVDWIAGDRRESSDEAFREARELTTWHYQWPADCISGRSAGGS